MSNCKHSHLMCVACLSDVPDRQVSQSAEQVARAIVNAWAIETLKVDLDYVADQMHEDFKELANRIAAAIDAARPKVTESDEQAARRMVMLVHNLNLSAPDYAAVESAIAQDRASVRDAARLAERERLANAYGWQACGVQGDNPRNVLITFESAELADRFCAGIQPNPGPIVRG